MKKVLSALVLVVAVFATVGSADDTKSSGGSAPTTAGASTGGENGDTAAPAGDLNVGAADEVDDVTITACGEKDALGFTTATIEVVNNSSKASNYLIEIAFESADGSAQLATGNAYITSLAPNQSKTEEVNSLEEIAEAEVTCRLASVDRLAA